MKITNDDLMNVSIDTQTEPVLGLDQMFIRTPIVFPQIQFELFDTAGLTKIADAIRVSESCLPCFHGDKLDNDGYYRFFVTLYGVWPGCENCITFTYVDGYTGAETEHNNYEIELSDEQRLALFMTLNRQCDCDFGESAVDMMAEYCNKEGLNWRGMRNA